MSNEGLNASEPDKLLSQTDIEWVRGKPQKRGSRSDVDSAHATGQPTTLGQKWQEWRTIREAASRVVRSESHFTRRDLIGRIAEASQTRGIDAEGVFALTEKYLASRQVMSLGVVDGEERFTTKRLWKLERQILTQVRDLDRDRLRFRVPSHRITAAARTYHLTPTQTEAVRTLSARGRIKSLAGISGTGKTHTLGAVREAFERSGYRVIGITPSKRGAERLQEQGAFGKQSRLSGALFGRKQQPITLHRLFWELDRAKESQRQYGRRSIYKSPLSRTTVVIADSAQDLSAVQMKRLVARVKQAGAKLILSGDQSRSAAYEHGGAFRAIARTLNAPELSEIKRQESQLGRELVRHVDRGRAILALGKLDERGQFSTSPTREKAIEQLVRVWAKQGCKHPATISF
ncbi:AAA family ATPase [Oscillatoriales cyanobacterium LEGE 11467]|uniref:AAA family ATPase n=2 Tax=Zarconia TaxID=2992130 RepID=A0A928Z6P2_9CYAN|nr:AAA family ATPase [Zarconia navalis LEGE 11467]